MTLPAGWTQRRARFAFTRRDVRGADAPLASATKDGVLPRTDLDFSVWNPDSDVSNYKLVEPDDFVIGLRSFQHGLSHSSVRGLVSPAYTVLRPVADLDPRFYKYYFRSAHLISQLANITQGIRQGQAIDVEAFENLGIVVPPVGEQRLIAAFLDRKTAQIDRLSQKMERDASLLEECRTAVLDTIWTSSSKEESKRLGYGALLVTSGSRAWGNFLGSDGSLFFRSANLRRDSLRPNLSNLIYADPPTSVAAETIRSRIRVGDVLVGITGANTGWVTLAEESIAGGNVSQHVCLVRPSTEIVGKWLAYLIASPTIQSELMGNQYGGTKTQLSLPDIRNIQIPVLAVWQQQAVAADIESQLELIERQRRVRLQQIALIAERRQALITAAVTGQIDVSTASGRGVMEGLS